MNINDNSIKASSQDVAAFVDTALQNPDTEDFGSPFDGIRGLSTITRQKTSFDLIISDVVPAGQTADIYITQWNFENKGASTANMFYCLDQGPVSASPSPGLFDMLGTDGALPTTWTGAGLTLSIPAGSLAIYVMKPGTSPFPSSTAGIQGPVAPLKTAFLKFDEDVLHDCVRVLGSNWELMDNTNNLAQQGALFQGAWDVPSKLTQYVTRRALTHVGANMFNYTLPTVCRQASLPVGSPAELTKLNNQRTGVAKEGTLVMNRMDWDDNEPDYGVSLNEIYIGEPENSSIALNGRSQIGLIQNGTFVNYQTATATGVVSSGYQDDSVGQAYRTGIQMNMSIVQGVQSVYSATITRTMTTQCFINPRSQFRAFAKVSHTPVDYAIMQRVQNTMDNTPMFWPNKANGLGTAFKFAKSVWNKAAPIVKTVAPIAKSFLPAPAQAAINLASKAAAGPAATVAKEVAKAITKAKDDQKKKDAAKKK
jgi:hypothetical protein